MNLNYKIFLLWIVLVIVFVSVTGAQKQSNDDNAADSYSISDQNELESNAYSLIGLDEEEFGKVQVVSKIDQAHQKLIEEYLEWYNHFQDYDFKKIDNQESQESFKLRINGYYINEVGAFEINDKKYAINLLACDREIKPACAFRINGLPTKRIFLEDPVFYINEEVALYLDDISFYQCSLEGEPDPAFCDVPYEAYHTAHLTIKKR